ncbi:tetratricopeptide repeat protein [Saccharothrix sp. HUAS TT1]|uniref:tetratricopeptide repeat protein n=1 Tax=unclassified Saccharothrix TaxID=2593673 RepID=UPI00345C2613
MSPEHASSECVPPEYAPDTGPRALAVRLGALASAGVPVPCRVYVGLHEPGDTPPQHAVVTHAVARHFASGDTTALPRFTTNPSPLQRVYDAASLGRVDALGGDLAAFPADLASDLWRRVRERLAEPDDRVAAAEVLLRLGYQRHAADVLGMTSVDARTHVFDPASAVKQLAVLYWHPNAPRDLEALALRGARDERLPADARRSLALFVVVRNGRRGEDGPALHEAAALASALPPADGPARQSLHRALAFVPFLRGDVAGTFRLLDLAAQAQESSRPTGELERLAWVDHAFPLHETITKTHLRTGSPDPAVTASDELVALAPHDHRTWAVRGDALLAARRWEEAVEAFDRGVALGGLPAARAAFLRGWAFERVGRPAEAAESYRLSQRIDPTAPVVADRLVRTATGSACRPSRPR